MALHDSAAQFPEQRKRESFYGEYDETAARHIADTGIAPDDAMDIQLLYDALARLPQNQRESVILFEISGLSLEEIKKIQGGSLSGVKSRIARGRRKLATLLDVQETKTECATNQIAIQTTEMTEITHTQIVPLTFAHTGLKNNG